VAGSTVVGALKVLLQADTAQFEATLKGADSNVAKLANRLKQDLEPSQRAVNAAVRDFVGTREIGRAEAYAKAVAEIGGATRLTAQDQARVNSAVNEALAHYAKLGQEAPAHLKKLAAETKQAQTNTANLSGALETMKGVLGAFGVQLGASALISFTKGVFEAADKVGDLALKMGVGVEAAQRFQFAARQSGAEIEDVSAAIVKMSNNLAEGDKSTVSALDQIGLKFADIRAMKPEDAFRSIADAIGRIPDPMEQANVALALFGKGGATLLPMIRENSLAVADGIEVMSETTVRELKDAQQAWENFWNRLTIITGNAIGEMLPQITKMIDDLTTGTKFLLRFVEASTQTNSANALRQALGMGLADFLSAQQQQAQADAKRAARQMTGWSTGEVQEVGNVGGGLFGSNLSASKKFLTKDEIAAMAKATADLTKEQDDAAAAAAAHAKALQQMADVFTGKKIAAEVKDFAAALGIAEKQGGVAADQIDDLMATIDKFIIAGAPIPDNVRSWFSAHVVSDVQTATDEIQRSINATADALSRLPPSLGIVRPTGGLLPGQGGGGDLSHLLGPAPAGPGFGNLFGRGITTGLGGISPVLLQAMTGGGDPTKSIAQLFGGSISTSLMGEVDAKGTFSTGLGKKLQGMFGGKAGGLMSGIVGGLSSFGISSAIELGIQGITKLIEHQQNATLKERRAFAESQGFDNLDALFGKLSEGGAGGEALRARAMLIGKQDKAGNEQWMKDVSTFFAQQAKNIALVTEKLGQAQAALVAFGGVAPKALQPMIDDLLTSTHLTAEQRTLLEGMKQPPAWQTVQQRAIDLGIPEGALGPAFQQARIKDQSFGFLHDIEMFVEQGADRDAVLTGMADELSALAADAVRTGRALPKALEQYIRRLQEMGLLVDDQGNAIADGLRFEEMQDESLKAVVSVLEEIRELLAGPPAPAAPGDGTTAPTPPPGMGAQPPGTVTPVDGQRGHQAPTLEAALPSFAAGTNGAYADFGPGTPVMLHGRERVMTEAEGAALGGGMMTVIVEADGRTLSRIVTPFIPGEVRRLGLGRS
jgi:hypothetical protein